MKQLVISLIMGIFSYSLLPCFVVAGPVQMQIKTQRPGRSDFLVEYPSIQYQDVVSTMRKLSEQDEERGSFDIFSGAAGTTLATLTSLAYAPADPLAATWVGGDNYVVIGFDATTELRAYSFDLVGGLLFVDSDSAAITPQLPVALDTLGSSLIFAVACSGGGTGKVVVYILSGGASLVPLVSVSPFVTTGSMTDARWSPDGKFLAVCGTDGVGQLNPNIVVYSFDGSSLTFVDSVSISPGVASTARSIAWSFDGNYLIAGGDDTTDRFIKSYAFNHKSLTLVDTLIVTGSATNITRVLTEPTGQFVVYAGGFAGGFKIHTVFFSAGMLFAFTSSALISALSTGDIRWSKDFGYIAATYTNPAATTATLELFRLTRSLFIPVSVTTHSITPGGAFHARGLAMAIPALVLFLTEKGPDNLTVDNITESSLFRNRKLRANVYAQYDTMRELFIRPCFDQEPGGKFFHGAASDVNAIAWHPTGDFVAIGGTAGTGGAQVRVLSWDGAQLTNIPGCSEIHGADILGIAWRADGKYLAVGGYPDSLIPTNPSIRVYAFDGVSLTQVATATPGATVNQIAWSPNGHYLGAVHDNVFVDNLSLYSFEINALTLLATSAVGLVQTAIDWHPNGSTFLSAADAFLRVQSFSGGPIGLIFSVSFGSSINSVKWHPSGRYVAVGGNTGTDELKVYFYDGATLTEISSFAHGADVHAVDWSPCGGHLVIVADEDANDVTMRIFDFDGGRLREAPACAFKHGADLFGASWSPAESFIMACGQPGAATFQTRMFFFKGLFNQDIIDSSRLHGLSRGLIQNARGAAEGFDSGLIKLGTIDHGPANIHFSSSTITLSYQLNISTDHTLNIHSSGVIDGNGHTIHLSDFTGPSIILDAGISVTFENMTLENYTEASVSLGAGSELIFGNNTTVELGESQAITNPWLFAGYATLFGDGYTLRPGADPAYVAVFQGGKLRFEDVTIDNLQGNNLRCLDTDASMAFRNCHLILSNDFSFTVGSLSFHGDVLMSGTSEFGYRTGTASYIDAMSRLMLDTDMIFNYDPSLLSKDLFLFTDSSSQLQLNRNIIRVNTAGWRWIRGRMVIEGENQIDSSALLLAQAVEIGNGVAADDFQLIFMPEATLTLINGFMDFLNVN